MYNFENNLILSFTNPIHTGSFIEHAEWFKKCVIAYNEKSEVSNVNRKKIEISEIKENEIVIKLLSEDKIETPGRALKYLSQLIITEGDVDYDDYYSRHLFHKKLFKVTIPARVNDNDTIQYVDTSTISDSEFIKSLIDYLAKSKDYSEDCKKTIEKMKVLAVEVGILKISK